MDTSFDVIGNTEGTTIYYEHETGVNYIKDGWSMMQNTVPFNLTGHPAISIPCGKINGLPVGLMLVSKHFNEAQLLQVAKGYETILNWKTNNK